MGVACLKLEGRMKRPEYVAVITGIYRRLLDEKRRPTPGGVRGSWRPAFSRSGFTDGYYQGRTGPEMFGTRPENAPEPKELFARAKAAVQQGGQPAGCRWTWSALCRAGEPVSPDGAAPGDTSSGREGPVPEDGPEPGPDGGGVAIPAGENRRHRLPAAGRPGWTLEEGLMLLGQRRERPAAAGSGGRWRPPWPSRRCGGRVPASAPAPGPAGA